ncbi:MAG: hypothetical protein ACE5HD_06345 [Acidobacteriota bacterium]
MPQGLNRTAVGALFLAVAAVFLAGCADTASAHPLDVTYYYLPG